MPSETSSVSSAAEGRPVLPLSARPPVRRNGDRHRGVCHDDPVAARREIIHAKTLDGHPALYGPRALAADGHHGHDPFQVHLARLRACDLNLDRYGPEIANPQDLHQSAKAAPGNGVLYGAAGGLGDVFTMQVDAGPDLNDKPPGFHIRLSSPPLFRRTNASFSERYPGPSGFSESAAMESAR